MNTSTDSTQALDALRSTAHNLATATPDGAYLAAQLASANIRFLADMLERALIERRAHAGRN